MTADAAIRKLLDDYSQLEPGDADAWNPVGSKFQLGYRLNLYYALARALSLAGVPAADLRVLDLGCGNGRSTRMYLDMGLEPDQLTGLDLRPGALDRARRLNPAIAWRLHDGGPLPAGSNWISMATVFSSVSTAAARVALVDQIRDALPGSGYAFYFDARKANPFAGGDRIRPTRLFADFEVVWRQPLGRFTSIPLRERLRGLWTSRLLGDATRTASLREMLGDAMAPSNEAILFRKRGD
jgi:SAM-dependent methyltransferase